jgi:hypothetical protein
LYLVAFLRLTLLWLPAELLLIANIRRFSSTICLVFGNTKVHYLLTGPEDRATQVCDPSAETGGYTVEWAWSFSMPLAIIPQVACNAINAIFIFILLPNLWDNNKKLIAVGGEFHLVQQAYESPDKDEKVILATLEKRARNV